MKLNNLPPSSFISFKTYKLKGSELVWFNYDLAREYGFTGDISEISQEILEKYSYVSDGYVGEEFLDLNDNKEFFADRYGSRYEACNGGSARCGYDGIFQVKGIGANPLVSSNIDRGHSNGKLFLDEAILESIWGEICHSHLPFGSVRTLAIIRTNVDSEFTYLQGNPLMPCALVVREFAIRPAHFERCTFFWPKKEHLSLRDNDATRVEEAIGLLPRLVHSSEQDKTILESLITIIIKMAKQISYSRIKGIPHGSLTSSNISIDGRFLDFGTITAVPDFKNYLLSNGVGAVWDDHYLILDWLDNLIKTINTYSNDEVFISENDFVKLKNLFLTEMDNNQSMALLEELGAINTLENLSKSQDLIKSMVDLRRVRIGEFTDLDFRKELVSKAKEIGITCGEVKFDLRRKKYSSFIMLKEVKKHNYSNESINKLINNMLEM